MPEVISANNKTAMYLYFLSMMNLLLLAFVALDPFCSSKAGMIDLTTL